MNEANAEWNREKEYRSLSKLFRFYKLAALALCLMFVVGGLMVFKDDITVENFRYLIRYLDTGSGNLDSTEALLEFDSGETAGSRAALYKNDLVMVNQNSFEVFDFRNGKIFNDTFTMAQPALSVSSSHVLVYDLGGKQTRLYNSFSLLREQTYEYPIYCADADDSGRYAVATSEKNYHCAVYVYNGAHARVFRWLSADKYVSDISLADDGSQALGIAAVKAEGGDLVAELLVFSTDDSESGQSLSFSGEMPLKVYIEGSHARLLTDRALHSVDLKTKEVKTTALDADKLSMYGFFSSFSAIVLNDNTVGVRQEVCIVCEDGSVKTVILEDQVTDLSCHGENLYLLLSDSVLCVDSQTGVQTVYPLAEPYTQLCMAGEKNAVLVAGTHARLSILKPEEELLPAGNQA